MPKFIYHTQYQRINNINFTTEDEGIDENKELNNYPDLSNYQKGVYLFNKFNNWLEKTNITLTQISTLI